MKEKSLCSPPESPKSLILSSPPYPILESSSIPSLDLSQRAAKANQLGQQKSILKKEEEEEDEERANREMRSQQTSCVSMGTTYKRKTNTISHLSIGEQTGKKRRESQEEVCGLHEGAEEREAQDQETQFVGVNVREVNPYKQPPSFHDFL